MIFTNRTSTRRERPTVDARARAGVTALEFALAMPLFVFTFLYSIQVMRVSMICNSMDVALMEGARIGSLPNKDAEDVRRATMQSLQQDGIRSFDVEASEQSGIGAGSETVSVEVSVNLSDNGLSLPGMGGEIEKSTTLDKENKESKKGKGSGNSP